SHNKLHTPKLNQNTQHKQSTPHQNHTHIHHQPTSSNLTHEQKQKPQSFQVQTQQDSTQTSNPKNEKLHHQAHVKANPTSSEHKPKPQ
ncbi:hypothetical protein, partial [Staphylococcus saprophyticus]|uniref:hypothetical protein n=1 Tax=Staphylococcus saprophyticus TaxID=29385 RepID=UPI001C92C2D9